MSWSGRSLRRSGRCVRAGMAGRGISWRPASSRASAVITARSPVRFRAGDLVAQDVISCRSTKISTSLEVSLRASSATQPNNRIISR
jgi:hypothetical protein